MRDLIVSRLRAMIAVICAIHAFSMTPETARPPETPARPTLARTLGADELGRLDWGRSAYAAPPPQQIERAEMPEKGFDFHYLRRYRPAVDVLVEQAPPLLERAMGELGLAAMPAVEVWVLPQVSDYYELRGEPNRAPEWAVGLSLSGRSTIILAHGADRVPHEVMLTFAHELAHVAVDHARGETPVPRWFHEGFAVYLAQEWTAERSEKLSQAAAGGRLANFDSLRVNFPSHQSQVSLAYDQSFHFVRWLRLEYGAQFWPQVMQELAGGATFDEALAHQSGQTLAQLEARWREALVSSTTLWSLLADETLIFFGVSVLFIVTYLSVWWRRRRRMAAMRDDSGDDWHYDAARYPLPGEDRTR